MTRLRLRRALTAVALAAAIGATFADDPGGASYRGTWRSSSEKTPSLARVVFTPSADGTVCVAGDLALDGGTPRFTTSGRLDGDALGVEAELARSGFVDRLSAGAGASSVTLRVRFLLDRMAGKIEATWRTSTGVEGRDVFTQLGSGWSEKPLGGSFEAEAAAIAALVTRVTNQQDEVKKDVPERGFHNKGFGVRAELRVAGSLAPDLQVGLFQPGAVYPAIARFSNAGSASRSDAGFDQRGLAFRVKTGQVATLLSGEQADAQDFLTTNSSITTRDPVQFLDTARALTIARSELLDLKKKYGTKEALYAITHLARGTALTSSHATEKLWSSRAPLKWGRIAVKVALTPATVPSRALSIGGGISGFFKGVGARFDLRDKLAQDLRLRLANGDIVFDMWVQRFDTEATTPIEDGSIEWQTPLEKVGQLFFTADEDLEDEESKALAGEIEKLAFNPWNCTEDFRPLGSIMRARKDVYKASAGHRGACPFGFVFR